jgi:hypothetical protein
MSTKKVLVKVEFDLELEVAWETTKGEIQEIVNDMDYHFYYGDRVGASREEMVDIDILPE